MFSEPLVVRDDEGQHLLGIGRDAWRKLKRSGDVELCEVTPGSGIYGVTMRSLKKLVEQRTVKAGVA